MSYQNDVLHNFGAPTNVGVSCSTVDSHYAGVATESPPAFLRIQNVGTVPVFYRLTPDASVAATATTGAATTTAGYYTGILAAGDAANDGTGGTESFAGYTGGISFITASGTSTVALAYSGRLGN
jgi:hypothetical protein